MTSAPAQIEAVLPAPERQRSLLDMLGIGLSALCVVHCLALPAILVALPQLSALAGLNQAFHIALAILLPGIAAVALYVGFRRHREPLTLVLGGLGLAFIWLALAVPCGSCSGCASGVEHAHTVPMVAGLPLHNIVNSIGSVLLISAHGLNWRACRTGACGSACHAH